MQKAGFLTTRLICLSVPYTPVLIITSSETYFYVPRLLNTVLIETLSLKRTLENLKTFKGLPDKISNFITLKLSGIPPSRKPWRNYSVGSEHACLAAVPRSTLESGTFLLGKIFPSSADLRRVSCQLLAKEWTLNTDKLPSGGLPRNSVAR